MRRKCPKVGDLVLWQADGRSIGWVVKCVGIHVWVRFFDADPEHWDAYIPRTKVEVLSSANSR